MSEVQIICPFYYYELDKHLVNDRYLNKHIGEKIGLKISFNQQFA